MLERDIAGFVVVQATVGCKECFGKLPEKRAVCVRLCGVGLYAHKHTFPDAAFLSRASSPRRFENR